MALASSTVAWIGVATAAVGAGAAYYESKKGAEEAKELQEKANRTEAAQAQVESARRRRRAIAQARVAQAQNQSMEGQAVQGSSMLSGVQSGVATQLGANIGAQQQQIGTMQQTMNLRQQATNTLRESQNKANLYSSLGQIGASSAMTFDGGSDDGTVNSWFSNTP